jgi:hypothetical protein
MTGGNFLADGRVLSSLLMALFALSAEGCFQLAVHLLSMERQPAR